MSSIITVYLNEEEKILLKQKFPTKINKPFEGTSAGRLIGVGFISNTEKQFTDVYRCLVMNNLVHQTIFMDGDTDVILDVNHLQKRSNEEISIK